MLKEIGSMDLSLLQHMIVKELREIYNLDLDKAKVKNRLKTIKEHFVECYDLFKHTSGFAWSPVTRMFTAKPGVWEALIEILQLISLVEIYGKDRAIDVDLESFNLVDEDVVVLSPKSGTFLKAKKRRLSNGGERDVDILKTALQDIALAIREGNASMEKSQGCFPIGVLYKALEEIGIAPHLFTDAYVFLTKKFERMMQFYGCPVEYRKEILENMMYDPENRW
ncbi:hypothetical protein CsSME_00019626 [Camellia sinensis var. sinensis]